MDGVDGVVGVVGLTAAGGRSFPACVVDSTTVVIAFGADVAFGVVAPTAGGGGVATMNRGSVAGGGAAGSVAGVGLETKGTGVVRSVEDAACPTSCSTGAGDVGEYNAVGETGPASPTSAASAASRLHCGV